MKYFKNKIAFQFPMLLAVLLLLQGCSDFLEQEPGTQTSITEQLKDKNGMLMALTGLYASVQANLRSPNFAVYADVQGGNLKFTPSVVSTSRGVIEIPDAIENVYSFDDKQQLSNFSSFYAESYDIINQCNLILEFADALPDATDAEKNQIKAEALTIRAYSHFILAELYAQNYGFTENASHLGIACISKSIIGGLQYTARETVANTYNFIIDDLTNALGWYGNQALLSGPAYSYFNTSSTKALLARVYLSKKDWKNAYETANDIILNSGVSLMASADYIAQWEKPDLPVSEILLEFSIPRANDGTASGSMSAYFGYTSETVFADYAASKDLLDVYETADIRKKMFLEQPLSTLVNGLQVKQNYYFTKKFQGNPGYVAFRLSELYLIRAEAALGLNNPDQAKTDINTIRARANATLLTTNENLAEAVFLERRKELCFEGHLFFDIVRNKKNILRSDGCISLNCNPAYPSPKFVLPLPVSTLNLNTNLKQNESY